MIITPHYGGSVVRVQLTNRFGTAPVTFHDVAIAHSGGGASLVSGSSRPVLFAGKRSVTVSAGWDMLPDPAAFTFQAFDNLAVSMYLHAVSLSTEHFVGRQVSYGTLALAGVTSPTRPGRCSYRPPRPGTSRMGWMSVPAAPAPW